MPFVVAIRTAAELRAELAMLRLLVEFADQRRARTATLSRIAALLEPFRLACQSADSNWFVGDMPLRRRHTWPVLQQLQALVVEGQRRLGEPTGMLEDPSGFGGQVIDALLAVDQLLLEACRFLDVRGGPPVSWSEASHPWMVIAHFDLCDSTRADPEALEEVIERKRAHLGDLARRRGLGLVRSEGDGVYVAAAPRSEAGLDEDQERAAAVGQVVGAALELLRLCDQMNHDSSLVARYRSPIALRALVAVGDGDAAMTQLRATPPRASVSPSKAAPGGVVTLLPLVPLGAVIHLAPIAERLDLGRGASMPVHVIRAAPSLEDVRARGYQDRRRSVRRSEYRSVFIAVVDGATSDRHQAFTIDVSTGGAALVPRDLGDDEARALLELLSPGTELTIEGLGDDPSRAPRRARVRHVHRGALRVGVEFID